MDIDWFGEWILRIISQFDKSWIFLLILNMRVSRETCLEEDASFTLFRLLGNF